MQSRLCAVIFACGLLANIAAADSPRPLLQAHAHNDYEHIRPFWEAFELGFCNVEADIHLVDGNLLVAHDLKSVQPELTLQALYLEPLKKMANEGKISSALRPMTLLIDVKSTAEPTYEVLHKVLGQYASILTRFESNSVVTNAVTVVISGERARESMRQQPVRYATYDGRMEDLDASDPATFIWWISDNWSQHFKWRGVGEISADDLAKLRETVAKVHLHGRKLRFWGMPDNEQVWRVLQTNHVDIIGTDHLRELRDFLNR